MKVLIIVLVIVVVLLLIGAAMSVRVVKQYEQGVLFRLGKVLGARVPGLRIIIPFVDVLHRVSLRIVTMPIQSQGIITQDNVSVDVSAVAYFRVVDAVKSVVAIENVYSAIDQIAQTRRCPRPTRSTWTSARSWTSPLSSGGWKSPWSSSRTSSCPTP
jgi:regulator of protease activity HflC (stomatin/prohibitin superfamily)